ncbi:cardiolipin synthase (CMP-forming) [[Candida] railenensis]|uniref:Cardiolipin synthase (CMP-forming) n=1 Tax=[Candida] railenensis TaxID=45579 RepID=A0A9P0QPP6_9ASCO|nr:cardiolipin synthase (CMP-forming) [[Candida] railenensis]
MIRVGILSRTRLVNANSIIKPSTFVRSFRTSLLLHREQPKNELKHTLEPNAKKTFQKQRDTYQRQKESTKQLIAKTQAYQKELQSTTKKNIETIIPKHENIYTIPNILTFTRIATTPVIGYLLCHNQTAWAMSFFIYSCCTDFVDGYIARKYNMGSVLGSIIDPMADKFLMTVCTLSLCYNSTMPLYLATLIIGRDVMLGFMALYYRFVSLPQPRTFLRFWDFSIPSASVHPTTLSKWNTGFQMVYIGSLMLRPGIEMMLVDSEWISALDYFLTGFGYLVASTTFISGATYLFSKDAVKIIGKK